MSTNDLLMADFDFVVDGLFGESIYYKSLYGQSESAIEWSSMNAIVDPAAEGMGVSADFGRPAIIVNVSKTDLESVTEGVDKIKHNGKTYVVHKILSQDAGGWELYCI